MIIYPTTAGYTEHETSKDAANAIEGSGRAETLRAEVLRVLRVEQAMHDRPYATTQWAPGMTADEIAAELGESILSVRPRVAELNKRGLIVKTGERRRSSGGRMSHVWRLA